MNNTGPTFQSLYAQRADNNFTSHYGYERCEVDFRTGARSITSSNVKYHENGCIQLTSSIHGDPGWRKQLSKMFGIGAYSTGEFPHKLATPDGKPVPKGWIRSSTLWFDVEHNMVVNGDYPLSYMMESSWPLQEKPIVAHEQDKDLNDRVADVLVHAMQQISAERQLQEVTPDKLLNSEMPSKRKMRDLFIDIAKHGKIPESAGGWLKKHWMGWLEHHVAMCPVDAKAFRRAIMEPIKVANYVEVKYQWLKVVS